MNPLDTRKRLAAFAKQIRGGGRVTKAQALYLANVFERISKGEDANMVLGIKSKRGQSEKAAKARQDMSKILHWVAGSIERDDIHEVEPYTLDKACQEAVKHFKLEHDSDYIKKQWYENPHMRSSIRTWSDEDSPFHP